MRVTYHYLFSIIALIFYGGQVCPFIDTLSISRWGATLVLMFAIAYLARRPLMGVFVLNLPLNRQVRRQFALDMSLFFSSGLIISIYNHLLFDFPLGSGAKITLGCLTLGFFAAADMVLQRERDNHEMIAVSGGSIEFTDSSLSLTGRFFLISSFTVLFMAAVIFLVVSRDLLIWIESIGPEGLLSARLTVVKELAFVGGIFLLEVINLVFSFSKNLKLFFNNENETLIGVAEGDLDRLATVSTGDEFGIMASYTNEMIKNLKESTENLQKTQDVTILTLASLAETRDNETGAHILRTQHYVKALAEEIRLDDKYTLELNEEYVADRKSVV